MGAIAAVDMLVALQPVPARAVNLPGSVTIASTKSLLDTVLSQVSFCTWSTSS